jgi:O-acetylhomoserine/O-acetylserine sulfhydrylase-like pyridoxal-dependent enzyme
MAFVFSSDGHEKYGMLAKWNAGQNLATIAAFYGCTTTLVDATIKSLAVEGCFVPVVVTGL